MPNRIDDYTKDALREVAPDCKTERDHDLMPLINRAMDLGYRPNDFGEIDFEEQIQLDDDHAYDYLILPEASCTLDEAVSRALVTPEDYEDMWASIENPGSSDDDSEALDELSKLANEYALNGCTSVYTTYRWWRGSGLTCFSESPSWYGIPNAAPFITELSIKKGGRGATTGWQMGQTSYRDPNTGATNPTTLRYNSTYSWQYGGFGRRVQGLAMRNRRTWIRCNRWSC